MSEETRPDFNQCRCGEYIGLTIHQLETPTYVNGLVFCVVCKKCGLGVPFVHYGWSLDRVNESAVAAWNAEIDRQVAPPVVVAWIGRSELADLRSGYRHSATVTKSSVYPDDVQLTTATRPDQ